MRNSKNITDRKKLKEFFRKGNLPRESDFEKLIDSTFNIADDKLDINEDGLMIYPSENGKQKLLSFFDDRKKDDPQWIMLISKKDDDTDDDSGGISFNQIIQSRKSDSTSEEIIKPAALFIQNGEGKIGIGTGEPKQQLEVIGTIASKGRMGIFHEGTVDTDGDWHNIFDSKEGLEGSHAYEIMAYTIGKNGDKSSLMHAVAVSSQGNSRSKITKTSAYSGKWWNKIDIRWESRLSRIEEESADDKKTGFSFSKLMKSLFGWQEKKDKKKYNLQLRTKSNYRNGEKLYFRVTELWNSDFIPTNKPIK